MNDDTSMSAKTQAIRDITSLIHQHWNSVLNPSTGIKSVNSIVAPIIGTGAIFTGSAEAMMRKTAEKIIIGIAIHGAFADSNPVRKCAIPIRIAATGKNKIHRNAVIFLGERIGHPRRRGKPEFKEGRYPPLMIGIRFFHPFCTRPTGGPGIEGVR